MSRDEQMKDLSTQLHELVQLELTNRGTVTSLSAEMRVIKDRLEVLQMLSMRKTGSHASDQVTGGSKPHDVTGAVGFHPLSSSDVCFPEQRNSEHHQQRRFDEAKADSQFHYGEISVI